MNTQNTLSLAIALSSLLYVGSAQASGNVAYTASNAKWKEECAACHIAYPAKLLPAESWKSMMGSLDKHFGSDASLDAASVTEISTFLQNNAGKQRGKAAAKPVLRITETSWFKREHDEISAQTWKKPLVKSAANCGACHTQADNGDFSEKNLRVPK